MENKWTPGTWKAVLEPAWGWCIKVNKEYLCFNIRNESDAKLIAKAPELVESLKEFVALANFDADTIPKTGEEWDAMVAKAERILREADAL